MVKIFHREFLQFFLLILFTTKVSTTKEEERVNLSEKAIESGERQKRVLGADQEDSELNLPLSKIFPGIRPNYKSTYVGNYSSAHFEKDVSIKTSDPVELESKKSKKSCKRRKRKRKRTNHRELVATDEKILQYELGPNVNDSLDTSQEIVSVDMNANYVKDILTGNWLINSDDGRKKKDKSGIMMKVLALFILPFLIQSSILPFLVAKLKLLLIKSIIVGKLAIFLLVVSAIKNSQKVATYEPIPAAYYSPEHPSRRSEAFTGYRVEGRPTAWVN